MAAASRRRGRDDRSEPCADRRVAGTAWQARLAEHQAERAEQQAAAARDQAQRVKRTKDFFVSVFQAADPLRKKDGAPVTLKDALDQALQRVDTELASDPSLQGDLLDDFGEIRAGFGDMAAAKAMFQRALPLHEQTLPADHPGIANTLVNLAAIENFQGNALAGRPFIERAVAILEQHEDAEGDALANARNGLATVYSESGDDRRALELSQQALAYYRKFPATHEIRLGTTLLTLGTLSVRLRRHQDAQAYAQESLAVFEHTLGKTNPYVGQCLKVLIFLAETRKDFEAMAAYAERGLEAARASFPGDHPFVVGNLSGLAIARSYQGRTAEAEALWREALAMGKRLGGHAEETIAIEKDLAESLEEHGRHAEALGFVDDAIGDCTRLPTAHSAREGVCRKLEPLRTLLLAAAPQAGLGKGH